MKLHLKKLVLCIALAILLSLAIIAAIYVFCSYLCNHDFKKIGTDEPTCTSYGRIYYECERCRKKTQKSIDPLEHELVNGDVEERLVGNTLWQKHKQVCERCGYSEDGEWENLGDYREYSVKVGFVLWLAAYGSFGTVMDLDTAIVSYLERDNFYVIIGTCRSVWGQTSHAVMGYVRLEQSNDEEKLNILTLHVCDKEMNVHITCANLDDEELIDDP